MTQSLFLQKSTMQIDIACVGFGPAMGGFLTTLSQALSDPNAQAGLESKAMPGMPLQVVCYERADDIGFGVSGVVSSGAVSGNPFPVLIPLKFRWLRR